MSHCLSSRPRGYANLCRLLTLAHAEDRLEPALPLDGARERNDGLVCLSGCARHGLAVRDPNAAARLASAFGRDRFFVELQRPYERGDARRNAALRELAETLGVDTVATGDVHSHSHRRAVLQDALVAIGHRSTLDGSERERRGNRECVLRPPAEAADCFPDDAAAVARTVELAARLEFDLTQELGYRYPDFADGEETADAQLRRVCERAFAERYAGANGHKRRARERLEEELRLIAYLELSGFFLLHFEVLELAREIALDLRGPSAARNALPPGRGRGSSVGSIVCYLTGLSHVDPVAAGLSLGRFLNHELASVPDIDLDFPRDVRERLIVEVTERYGREHAALVATSRRGARAAAAAVETSARPARIAAERAPARLGVPGAARRVVPAGETAFGRRPRVRPVRGAPRRRHASRLDAVGGRVADRISPAAVPRRARNAGRGVDRLATAWRLFQSPGRTNRRAKRRGSAVACAASRLQAEGCVRRYNGVGSHSLPAEAGRHSHAATSYAFGTNLYPGSRCWCASRI